MTTKAGTPSPLSDEDIRKFIGAQIRRDRERRKMSQSDLGVAIGVSFQQVQKYERGANNIPPPALARIAGLFGKSPGDYFPPTGAEVNISAETAMSSRLGVRLSQAFGRLGSDKAKEAAVFLVEALAQAEAAASNSG